ncbi:PAS domain-containing protein [Streptomyces phaeoluteigriseus]
MVIVDGTGVIKLINAQTETLFGYRREELLVQPVELLIPGRFHAHHAQHTVLAHARGWLPVGRQLLDQRLKCDEPGRPCAWQHGHTC